MMQSQSQYRGALPVMLFCCLMVAAQARASVSDHDVLCGPRSLLVICQRLGTVAKLNDLKELSGFDQSRGTTMLGLKQAAEAKGLQAVGMKIATEDLLGCKAVAIAHLWDNHFVVVEKGGGNTVKVTSPPGEPVLMRKEDFAKQYSGFALLVAKDEKAFPRDETKGPDLRCESYHYDFGLIDEGQQAGHKFILENKGVETLVLSNVVTSCTCTQAFLSEGANVIPPGKKGELTVGFDSTRRQGGQSQTIYIHSNDPITPIVHLRIVGVVKSVRLPVPLSSLRFGTVKKSDGASIEFSIPDPGDKSLIVTDATSDSPLVKTTLSRMEKNGILYFVKAELQPGAPIGELKSKLTIRSNHRNEPVTEIPVTAEVVGDIGVFPTQFFLGMIDKGQSVSKTITLSTTGKERLKIKKIDSPFDYITVKSKEDGDEFTITATLTNAAPPGLVKGDVIVYTNNDDQPEIKVPVCALVEE